jgi:hypothetical protein
VIQRAAFDGPWEIAGHVGPNLTYFIDRPTDLRPAYRYQVSAIGRWGASFPSEPIMASLPVDADSDGIHDDWELAHGLDPATAQDAELDPDGDGMSNRLEFLGGTDPRDPQSVLQLDVTRVTDDTVAIGFLAQPGRAYSLEWVPHFPADEWAACLELPAGSAAERIEIQTPVSGDGQSYYRVRLRSSE